MAAVTKPKIGKSDYHYGAYLEVAEKREGLKTQGLEILEQLGRATALLRLSKDTHPSLTSESYRQTPKPEYTTLKHSYEACRTSIIGFLEEIRNVISILEKVKESDTRLFAIDEDSEAVSLYSFCQGKLQELYSDIRFFESLEATFHFEDKDGHAFISSFDRVEAQASALTPEDSNTSASDADVSDITEAVTYTKLIKECNEHRDTALTLLQAMTAATRILELFKRIVSHPNALEAEKELARVELKKYQVLYSQHDSYLAHHTTLVERLSRNIHSFQAVSSADKKTHAYCRKVLPALGYTLFFHQKLSHRFGLVYDQHTPNFNTSYKTLAALLHPPETASWVDTLGKVAVTATGAVFGRWFSSPEAASARSSEKPSEAATRKSSSASEDEDDSFEHLSITDPTLPYSGLPTDTRERKTRITDDATAVDCLIKMVPETIWGPVIQSLVDKIPEHHASKSSSTPLQAYLKSWIDKPSQGSTTAKNTAAAYLLQLKQTMLSLLLQHTASIFFESQQLITRNLARSNELKQTFMEAYRKLGSYTPALTLEMQEPSETTQLGSISMIFKAAEVVTIPANDPGLVNLYTHAIAFYSCIEQLRAS